MKLDKIVKVNINMSGIKRIYIVRQIENEVISNRMAFESIDSANDFINKQEDKSSFWIVPLVLKLD